MSISKLLNSPDRDDREIGKIAIMHRNEQLFLEHIRYAAPWFILDPIPTSAILGECYYDSVYYEESLVQETFPNHINTIFARNVTYSENLSDAIEISELEMDHYIPTEEIDWDNI